MGKAQSHELHDPEARLGTQELEQGMHPGRAGDVARIAGIAIVMLLVFNAGGLAKWTETLPSNATTAWIAEQTAGWHRSMRNLGPAEVFDRLRARVRGE